jgi:hypothetical protein
MKSEINLSIFYNRCCWQNLLKKCVSPLFANSPLGELLLFNIFLSDKRGQHLLIKMHLKGKSKVSATKVAVMFEEFVRSFPSPPLAGQKGQQLFMNFPNNIVVRHCVNPDTYKEHEPLKVELRNALSRVLLEDADNFEGEGVLELVIYLHGGIFRATSDNLQEAEQLLRKFASTSLANIQNDPADNVEQVKNQLNKNQIEIAGFLLSLWSNNGSEVTPAFQEWLLRCRSFLYEDPSSAALNYLFSIVYQHLGLTRHMINVSISTHLLLLFKAAIEPSEKSFP